MYYIGITLAFILEIIVFVCFACIGFLIPIPFALQLILSLILLGCLIAFWGLYMSPKASKKLSRPHYYLAKIAIYSAAAIVILYTQNKVLGLLFIAVTVVDELVLLKKHSSQ